jgi:hypothetical protein
MIGPPRRIGTQITNMPIVGAMTMEALSAQVTTWQGMVMAHTIMERWSLIFAGASGSRLF